MFLCQLLQMVLVGNDQRHCVLLCRISVYANVLDDSASLKLRFNFAKGNILAGLQLNQILLTICKKRIIIKKMKEKALC